MGRHTTDSIKKQATHAPRKQGEIGEGQKRITSLNKASLGAHQ